MLTPEDLKNPQRKSGYDGVRYAPHPNGSGKPYQANKRIAPGKNGIATLGPRRATAEEAARDYCDYVNGNPSVPAPRLKSAGHTGKRDPMKDPEVEHALGVLKDARAQREGRQGYVYLIVESLPGGALTYGKIGYSTNPQARVAELQTGNPRPLKLLYAMPGTPADESALHTKYIKSNVLQEWFWLDASIICEFPPETKVNEGTQ